jgi:enterochelin esterase-like enzyme
MLPASINRRSRGIGRKFRVPPPNTRVTQVLPAPRTDPPPGAVTFTLADDGRQLQAVRLWQEVHLPGDQLDLHRDGDVWSVTVPRPGVDRMEYQFELTYANGAHETICDPANPLRVGGAFGDHSVLEFAEYRRPAWLAVDLAGPGTYVDLDVAAEGVGQDITGRLWSAPGLDRDATAPMLVVHDGPEYDQFAGLTHYLGAMVRSSAIPPLRAALLAPGPRDDWYAASGAYGRALTGAVLPHLRSVVAVTKVVGVGASLGALEMLVAHRSAPAAFDGLFLQSGSYFQRGLDDQEHDFAKFARITRSVGGMLASARTRRPVPIVLTCGETEENLGNNRAMARALVEQGYPATLREVRDVHSYTAWRDAFDPYLTDLIRLVTGETPSTASSPTPGPRQRTRP